MSFQVFFSNRTVCLANKDSAQNKDSVLFNKEAKEAIFFAKRKQSSRHIVFHQSGGWGLCHAILKLSVARNGRLSFQKFPNGFTWDQV